MHRARRSPLLDYGGVIVSISVPDRSGKLADVVLGYDTLDGYLGDNPHYGAIVGRYANRIGGARFALDGRTYELAANNGPNSLHGGRKGFDRAVWHAEPFERDGTAGVVLTHASPDGDEGFPGALSVSVTYTFNDRGELAIDYRATTDKATVMNLTNHSYFNLAGDGSGDVLGHRMTLNADRYTPVDKDLIPVGELASVAGTPLDFRAATAIGARIVDPALEPPGLRPQLRDQSRRRERSAGRACGRSEVRTRAGSVHDRARRAALHGQSPRWVEKRAGGPRLRQIRRVLSRDAALSRFAQQAVVSDHDVAARRDLQVANGVRLQRVLIRRGAKYALVVGRWRRIERGRGCNDSGAGVILGSIRR